MKWKLQIGDYLIIAGIIIGFVATCFTNEIRRLIMEKWQIITLIVLANAFIIKVLHIWGRNKLENLKSQITSMEEKKAGNEDVMWYALDYRTKMLRANKQFTEEDEKIAIKKILEKNFGKIMLVDDINAIMKRFYK